MTTSDQPPDDEVVRLRGQVEYLRQRIRQLERERDAALPIIAAVRRARIWDFAPYDVTPDPTNWVAIDRDDALSLLRALSGTDHWHPWTTVIERRGAT